MLQNLPFFRVWTKTQLLKLVNFIIEPKHYIRNQVVYREGDPSETIYIVKSGDFEVSRKHQKNADYSLKPRNEAAGKANPGDLWKNLFENNGEETKGTAVSTNKGKYGDKGGKKGQVMMERQVRNVETFKLVLLGPGQIFGDDDVLFNRPYSSTIVCRSNLGTVIRMNGPELLKKMRANEECWKLF